MSAIAKPLIRCKRPIVAKPRRRMEQSIFRTIVEMAYEMDGTEKFPAVFKHVKEHVETHLYEVHQQYCLSVKTKKAYKLNPDTEPALPKIKHKQGWIDQCSGSLRGNSNTLTRRNIYPYDTRPYDMIDNYVAPSIMAFTTYLEWNPSKTNDNGEPLEWSLTPTLWIGALAYLPDGVNWKTFNISMDQPFDDFRKDIIKLVRNTRFYTFD